MQVPFRLRKNVQSTAATGLLLPRADTADLLALLAALGADPLPPVFAVAAGFLVKLAAPAERAAAGVVRLRSLAADLFLPVDAELLPALLDDEAAALVRERGLVFLPGGRVFGYEPRRPLALASFLQMPQVRRRAWQTLPELPRRADRLLEVVLDRQAENTDALLVPEGPPIGTDEPRPANAGFLSKMSARSLMGLGSGFVWIGKMLGWKRLARLGAGLVQSAVAWVPRLSESVLGRQEAALRELLRLFRSGQLENALRRALPVGRESDRGGSAATDANLPPHNTTYSLSSLLAGSGRGSLWFGGGNVVIDLMKEYRRAAEAAAARGDFRRAAFIYGKLLNDYQAAADVLARGGLHHDAAIVYLEKLGNTVAAARQFEAGGEFDRALKIFRERGDHGSAGDLLQRLGEDEEAQREYLLAAADLVAQQHYLAAGNLLLTKARRRDLALEHFREGWAAWPAADAPACLVSLAQVHAEETSPVALIEVAKEAALFFESHASANQAGSFFNELARLADRPNLVAVRDDLRDRALCGLASQLRRRSAEETRPGAQVSSLLGQPGVWSPAVVSDAEVAYLAAVQSTKVMPQLRKHRAASRIRVGRGTVVSVCAAPKGRVFVGYESGEVVSFDPFQNAALPVHPKSDPASITTAITMATDPGGDQIVVLQGDPNNKWELGLHLCQQDSWVLVHRSQLPAASNYLLTPIALDRADPVVGIWDGKEGRLLRGPTLVSEDSFHGTALGIDLETVCDIVLLPPRAIIGRDGLQPGACVIDISASLRAPPLAFSLAFLDDRDFWWSSPKDRCWHHTHLGWTVPLDKRWALRQGSLLFHEQQSWNVALFRLGNGGRIYSAQLQCVGDQWERVECAATGCAGYSAGAILLSRQMVGVQADRIDWLRIDPNQCHLLKVWDSTPLSLEGAVACCSSPLTSEVIVVLQDGWLVRVPVPH
jgi:tetratricopeptide (TPR) repeat protein